MFQGYVGKILRNIEPEIWHLEIPFGNQHFQVGWSFNIEWDSFIQNHLRKRTVIPGTFSWDLQEKHKVNLGNLVKFPVKYIYLLKMYVILGYPCSGDLEYTMYLFERIP